MKRFGAAISLFLFLLAIAACSKTSITQTWKEPSFQGKHLTNVLVVAVTQNQVARRNYEEAFVMELGKEGVEAYPSYHYLPGEKISREEVEAAVKRLGVHYVLITTLVGVEKKKEYNPPQTYITPRMGIGYYGYYYRAYNIVHEPGYYTTRVLVNLETTIYDVSTEKPVWMARSETMNPDSSAEVVKSVIEKLVLALKQDGFL